jgi:hypothetical protein
MLWDVNACLTPRGVTEGISAGLARDLAQSQKQLTEVRETLQRETVAYDNKRSESERHPMIRCTPFTF